MKKKALFVGVNDYKDDEIRNLHFALDDARSLHDIFEELGYKTAFLKNPGQGEILSQVRKMTEGLSVGDQFVFYFSGHGFTDDGQHLLFCVDDVYANLRYKRAGMPFELLEEETRKCGCDRVFMLDACRSDFLTGTRGADTTTKDLCPISHMVPKAADATGAFYVLRSCSRYEHAFEIDKKQHGLFTLAMMEVIRESKNAGSQLLFNDMLRETVEERMSQIARNVGLSVVQTPESEVRGRAQILINGRNGFSGIPSHSVASLVTCPICGKRNKIEDTFKCRQCGSDNLCLRHQDEKTFLCGNCSDEKRKSVKSTLQSQSMSAKDAYERGENYYYGRNGFGQDYAEAVKWYRKAAEQGYASGQCDLGFMYDNGQGVEQDESEAVKWYRKAAEQGYAQAQCNLGVVYYNGQGVEQDDSEAVKWYRKAAEQGHAAAQYNLGVMYANGRGVAKDDSEAVKWYRKAAEQGNASAQSYLGFMYQKGRGVTQDDSEAVKWYRKAAEQGDADAQCNLGFMYHNGRGVTQDDSEAVKWCRKAAEQGYADAQCNLGWMYENGRGVTQDESEAVKWYRKAAEQGHARAQRYLGVMYLSGRGVTQDDSEAVKWCRKAAEQGYALSQHNLGVMYENGISVDQNYVEALTWYLKAAVQEHDDARDALQQLLFKMLGSEDESDEAKKWCCHVMNEGNEDAIKIVEDAIKVVDQMVYDMIMESEVLSSSKQTSGEISPQNLYEQAENYYRGQNGVKEDRAKAFELYQKAAEQGHARAQYALGLMYESGRGVTQDDSEAVKWYRKAAEQGHARAQFALGVMYENGRGVTKDDYEAVKWYRKAAEQGYANAQFVLGVMYANGRGVTKDDYEAVKWYRKAAKQGDANAQFVLGWMYERGRGFQRNYEEAAIWYRKAISNGHEQAKECLKVIEKRIAEGSAMR